MTSKIGMKSKVGTPPFVVLAAALMLPLAGISASAQQGRQGAGPGGSGRAPDMMMGPGMMGRGGFGFMCSPRAAGMAEWRIKRIEEAVKPTDAQRTALTDLRTASTKAADTITAACTSDVPAKSPERLALMAKELLRTGTLQRWAYVACFAQCLPGEEDKAFARVKEFVAEAVPEFQRVGRAP